MKLSKEWKTLTRDQRRAWNQWAKNNKVLLDGGLLRRVSGHKAFTVVLSNQTLAGEVSSSGVLPVALTWLDGALSPVDAGPFTTNAGYVGFRTAQALASGLKWFVWATPPVDGDEADPHRRLRFVSCLSPGALAADDLIPGFGSAYQAVNGSWDGPGEDGEWPTPKFIWFRLHHFANGQLSPGVMMKGQIQLEL